RAARHDSDPAATLARARLALGEHREHLAELALGHRGLSEAAERRVDRGAHRGVRRVMRHDHDPELAPLLYAVTRESFGVGLAPSEAFARLAPRPVAPTDDHGLAVSPSDAASPAAAAPAARKRSVADRLGSREHRPHVRGAFDARDERGREPPSKIGLVVRLDPARYALQPWDSWQRALVDETCSLLFANVE